MLRNLRRFFYILLVPRSIRRKRMKRRQLTQIAGIPSIPVTGNVALPAQVRNGAATIRSILVLKLDHIGDFFISVEAMCRLREAWPDARITLICDPVNHDLACSLGIFDEVVKFRFFEERFEKGGAVFGEGDLNLRCAEIAALGLGRYDVAIDLRHDFDTRACLTYVEADFRVGYAKAGVRPPDAPVLDLALAEMPSEGAEQLHAETRVNMLVALMIDTFVRRRTRQISRLIDKGQGSHSLDGRPYMVIAPCARSANRTWPLENFIALAKRILTEKDLAVFVVGSAAERAQAAYLCEALGADRCSNFAGAPLSDLPGLLNGASLYVGNDTGSTHLAALLGVPTLCLYGGVSDPRVWQPLGPLVTIVHSRTPCSYCHINVEEDCLYNQRCMSEIGVDQAFREIGSLLARSSVARDEVVF